jgi:hypothetical protein
LKCAAEWAQFKPKKAKSRQKGVVMPVIDINDDQKTAGRVGQPFEPFSSDRWAKVSRHVDGLSGSYTSVSNHVLGPY